jgi:hypothetical protein
MISSPVPHTEPHTEQKNTSYHFYPTFDLLNFASVEDTRRAEEEGQQEGKKRKKESTMPPKLNVQNFPRPPRLERTSRRLRIKWNGKVIADTTDGYWALETHHAPS